MAANQVSEAAVAEINERAAAAQARLSAKQEDERKAGTDALVAVERSALDRIQAQVSELRLVSVDAALDGISVGSPSCVSNSVQSCLGGMLSNTIKCCPEHDVQAFQTAGSGLTQC